MRVFDCFTFSNELDLLEIRLNELSFVVDFFVIAESPWTFRGERKPLHYLENRQRYAAFHDRIRHVVVADMPAGQSGADNWRREYHQRNQIRRALTDLHAEDFVVLSDADEIPRASAIADALASPETPGFWLTVHCFELTWFEYYLDLQADEPWVRSSPRAIRFRNLRTLQDLRSIRPPIGASIHSAARWVRSSYLFRRPVKHVIHRNAGWHFSSMGGVEAVATKLGSYSHLPTEIASQDSSLREIALGRIARAKNADRLKLVPVDGRFPDYLRQNLPNYRHLFSEPDRPHEI